MNNNLSINQQIKIDQTLLPKSSHVKVFCECDICSDVFMRKFKDICQKGRDIKSITLCSKDCKKKYMQLNNPNPKKEKQKVYCIICKKENLVSQSKFNNQQNFCCSRECYKKHRSLNYSGENTYNFQNLETNCVNCNKSFKTIKYDLEHRERLFCSPECYHFYKKENYFEIYSFIDRNNNRKETVPEEKTLLYLESHNIEFIQEFSIKNIYFADFYLPKFNLILEVYGDYWHVNPEIYGKNLRKINNFQKEQIKKDKKRNHFIKNLGYEIIIIWEKDIKLDTERAIGNALDELKKNKQESSTTEC